MHPTQNALKATKTQYGCKDIFDKWLEIFYDRMKYALLHAKVLLELSILPNNVTCDVDEAEISYLNTNFHGVVALHTFKHIDMSSYLSSS